MNRFVIGVMFLLIANSGLGDSATKKVWDATSGNFITGELTYGDIHWTTGPGESVTLRSAQDLLRGAREDYRDMIFEAPTVWKNIYDLGIIQSYLNHQSMMGENWKLAKLSIKDFEAAHRSYAEEGNWAVLQCGYYYLKGSSRTLWALGVLNSAETMYSASRVVVLTGYFIVERPVRGTVQLAAAPLVAAGGTAWGLVTSVATAGWALPFAVIADTGRLATGTL